MVTVDDSRRSRAHIDWPLILISFALAIFGILAVTVATFSTGDSTDMTLIQHIASSTYAVRQCIFVGAIAPIVLSVMIMIPYQLLKRGTLIAFIAANVLLLVVWVFNRATGVKAWLDIFFGFTIQPSEFIKLATILMLAQELSRKEQPLTELKDWIRMGTIIGIPAFITLGSGEMGSLLVLVFLVIVMLWFGNVKLKTLFTLAGVGVIGIALLIGFAALSGSDSYRFQRLAAFVNPEQYASTDAYQMRQSMMVIGSGGLSGIGIFVDGAMSQLNYVPADWTDFIYASIGEAFGFIGCTAIVVTYMLLIFRLLYLQRYTRDRYGMLVIAGVVGMMLFHVLENIGMTIGLMPITGIPLPFISYGGSNMVVNMGGIGLALNVTRHRSLSHSILTPQTSVSTWSYGHGEERRSTKFRRWAKWVFRG